MLYKNIKCLRFVIFTCFILESSNISSQILPNNISGIAIWLNSDSINDDLFNNTYKWSDLSGNQNHARQSTSFKQPKKIGNLDKLNGKFTIHLDGIDDFLEITDNNSIDFTNAFTMFLIVKQENSVPLQTFLSKWNFGINGSWAIETGSSNSITNYILDAVNGGGGNQIQFTNLLNSLNKFNIIELKYEGNQSSLDKLKGYINGNLLVPTTLGVISSTLVNSTSNIRIGEFTNLGRNFNGDFAEILIYNKTLNSLEEFDIFNYLNNKFAPNILLPNDISSMNSFCDKIIIPLNSHNNQYIYQWSNGATTPTISVNKSGKYWVNATNIFGKISSDTILVTFPNYTKPIQKILCQYNSIQWNTNLPKNQYSFQWQNNSTDSIFNINQAGNYYVKITDSFSCSITSDTIKITQDNFQTTASLGPDLSMCAGNSITLTSGLSPSLTYTWSTGSHNPSLLISSSGQYSVAVTNTNNCIAKDTINVNVVGQAPTANFSSSNACASSSVLFSNLSSATSGNNITNNLWDFGDPLSAANSSTLANPSHTYSNPGSYSVSLNVTTNAGCQQSVKKTITVAPKPIVNFSSGISCQNDSTAFSNLSSSSSGFSITALNWNFGDPISGAANTSNLLQPKHLFNNQANYNVKLVATNNVGCKDSLVSNINVKAQVIASFTNSAPCLNTNVIFQDNSTVPSPSSSQIRTWNFGTTTATGLTVTKTYTNTGVYPVTLTVTGINGCISKISKVISVFLPPIVNFSIPSLCMNDTINAINLSSAQSGIISSNNWKINNAYLSSVQNPSISLNSSATYSVKLTVSNSFGCKDSITKPITVLPLPNVDFTTNPASYYFINSPINFIPNIPNATSYLWNISSNSPTTLQSPTTSFVNEGTYTVSLKLKDLQGCKNTKTKTIVVSMQFIDLAILNVNTVKDIDGFMTVTADLANVGTVPVNSFDMHYQISDGGNIKETWYGTLNPNSFYAYTFTSKSSTQKTNLNNITCVQIEKVNGTIDENISNNSLCNTLNSSEISISNPIPNPTEGDITLPIVLNRDINFSISIYNSIGQIQYSETTQKGSMGLNFVTLPTSSYARGCYIIKTQIDGKTYINKFIKINK